jgi:zinc transport system substrate-binding protein
MVETIAAAFIARDPDHASGYRRNADAYKAQLAQLDARYRDALARCRTRIIVHAGHFAFGYLARRYHLQYIPAYKGTASDAEPSPKQLAALIDMVRKHRLQTIFYEELIDPRLARVVAQETGATPRKLDAAHNVTREDMERGVTFLSLMDENLARLKAGLPCP